MSDERRTKIKRQWADAVDCYLDDCDDWPVERILTLEQRIVELEEQLSEACRLLSLVDLDDPEDVAAWQRIEDDPGRGGEAFPDSD